jgi:DNA invertase Pin-like site-specific DNA recombinase
MAGHGYGEGVCKDANADGQFVQAHRQQPRIRSLPRRPAAKAIQPAARVFAYCRVSTEGQAENGQSLEVQQRQLEGWALMHDARLAATYVEAGVSGAVPFSRRPEGGKLWAELRKGDTLVVSKLDRAFRSATDCLNVTDQLRARGVHLYLLDISGGDDLSAGNGQSTFFLQIMAAVAQFERSRISERIRGTKAAQKARREYLGGPVPFGFTYDAERKLVAIPEQQQAIERMRELHAEGMSLRKIAAELAAAGHKLSHMSVANILAGRSAA